MNQQTITPTDHDKREWARMAQACYSSGRNWTGHRFSGLAALRTGQVLPISIFDDAQRIYRAWLVFNEYPQPEL